MWRPWMAWWASPHRLAHALTTRRARRMHVAVDLARLSNGMVLYAWGYLTKAVDEETLEDLRESNEEALNDLRGARRS